MLKPTTTTSTNPNSAIYHKIAEKRANLEKLREFKDLTSDLVNQLESIGDKLETMNGGAASVALILSNWQSVIQSISLASMGLMKNTSGNEGGGADDEGGENFPEPLIRVKLDQQNGKEGTGELHDDELEEEEEEEDV